jgi:hypothetical protein
MCIVRFAMRFVLFAISGVLSCAGSNTQLDAKFAPEMQSSPHATIAVLGVMKAGRMSADAWIDLSPAIAPAFGGSCPVAFDDKLDGAVASAVDRQARENGVTESLFGAFVGATDADLVMLVEVSGQLPATKASHPISFRGGAPRGAMPSPTDDDDDESHDALEMSASVYSARLHRSVGTVSMRYTGKSAREALDRFAQKLGASLQGTRCTGWKQGAWPDPDAIKALK